MAALGGNCDEARYSRCLSKPTVEFPEKAATAGTTTQPHDAVPALPEAASRWPTSLTPWALHRAVDELPSLRASALSEKTARS